MKLSVAAVLMTGSMWTALGALQAQALPDSPAPQAANVPDSPRPQVLPNANAVAPGKGTSTSTDVPPAGPDGEAPPSTLGATAPPSSQVDPNENVAPDVKAVTGAGGRVAELQGVDEGPVTKLTVNTNFVEIPFTVKDKHGQLVPGITWRDVQVYENGVRRHMSFWTVEPYPLSVAFVLDQTLPYQVMTQVNMSLGAVGGAFSPYDEMAVYTYANGVSQRTAFTGAQSARLGAVLEQSKVEGRQMTYVSDGPMTRNVSINNGAQDVLHPLVNDSYHGAHGAGYANNPEKEFHPLYDAVFQAAQALSQTPKGRRRILYVVSDGKEAGSKVHEKELIKFLQGHNISVYATVVGDSATPYVGFLDKYHIPFTKLRDNALPKLASATGGESVSEFRRKGIEESFAKISDDVRLQYTVGYYSNEPLTDGKYRSVDVRVLKPDLDVIAKKGYYPTPATIRGTSAAPVRASSSAN